MMEPSNLEALNATAIKWVGDGRLMDTKKNIQLSLGSNLPLSNDMTFILVFSMYVVITKIYLHIILCLINLFAGYIVEILINCSNFCVCSFEPLQRLTVKASRISLNRKVTLIIRRSQPMIPWNC